MDPDGTKNRAISITSAGSACARRTRRSAAGPWRCPHQHAAEVAVGVQPVRQLSTPSGGQPGDGGGVCTFALELFFIVAFFLFLMFLPIVVFAFQLWWMLALRFCIPPTVSFSALADRRG